MQEFDRVKKAEAINLFILGSMYAKDWGLLLRARELKSLMLQCQRLTQEIVGFKSAGTRGGDLKVKSGDG